jgi:hypothetical protein
MIGLFCFALAVLASPFKSKLRLEAENAMLQHQLFVLRCRLHGRVRLTNNDRWFFIQLLSLVPPAFAIMHIFARRFRNRLGCPSGAHADYDQDADGGIVRAGTVDGATHDVQGTTS